MRLQYRIAIAGCVVALILTACLMNPLDFLLPPSAPEEPFHLPASTPSPKCTLPCFYDIVPGHTTVTETLSLLQATPEQLINNRLLEWNTQSSIRWNHILFERGVVEAIVLYEPTGATLGQMVDEHGAPQQVIVGSPGDEVSGEDFYFVYPTKGVAYFSAKPEPDSPWPKDAFVPTADMPVSGAVYFEPIQNDPPQKYRWSIDILSAARISPWYGFGQSYYVP